MHGPIEIQNETLILLNIVSEVWASISPERKKCGLHYCMHIESTEKFIEIDYD